jgi:hypothetical protein
VQRPLCATSTFFLHSLLTEFKENQLLSTQRQLRKKMINTFSLQDIKLLCFDLSIPYDEIPGENLSSKINSLLVSVYKLGNLESFYQMLVEERPKIGWPNLAELQSFRWQELEQAVDLPKSVQERVNQMGNVGDNNTIVQGDGNIVVGERGVNIGGNVSGDATITTGDNTTHIKEQTSIEKQTNIKEVKGDYVGGDKIGGDKYDVDGDMTINR